jgi:hypothetical protein
MELDKIAIIQGQTNYSKEEATTLLDENKGDYIAVIKQYMGIPLAKKEEPIKSINQAIYKQLRTKLDIQHFNDTHPPTLSE